jgi:hypothetical protein
MMKINLRRHGQCARVGRCDAPLWNTWAKGGNFRAALHLEDGPIRCVSGLISSLVIGRKPQIGLNPCTPRGRADLIV